MARGVPVGWAVRALPPRPTVFSSFTVSSWPVGQGAGSLAALIGRSTSKVDAQVRQRNS